MRLTVTCRKGRLHGFSQTLAGALLAVALGWGLSACATAPDDDLYRVAKDNRAQDDVGNTIDDDSAESPVLDEAIETEQEMIIDEASDPLPDEEPPAP